jgi:RNA polymerase sigma-70 factor (ECF subfamily)
MSAARVDDATVTGLALAAKAGDRAAATRFIEATYPDVHRLLAYLTDHRDAEDLAQETYLRAMGALPRFAAQSTARTWLWAIARRVAADHLRTAARRPRTAGRADGDVLPMQATGPRFEEQVALWDLLNALPAQRREAFITTQLLGLSYAEAAVVCDCPVGTIRSRVARAREDLVAAVRDAAGPATATG